MSIETQDGKLYLHYDEDGSVWEVLHACEHVIILDPMEEALEAGHPHKAFMLERYGDAFRLEWYDGIVQAFANLTTNTTHTQNTSPGKFPLEA